VLQELGLIDTLTVAENLELDGLPSRAGFIKSAELTRIARRHLERVGLADVDPAQLVSELGIGQQQLVEIARGLKGEARLLILDEPTAMLTAPEVERLFVQLAKLKAAGVGIIYISHRLDELQRIADRIMVLRDGQLVADRPIAQFTHNAIVKAMVGREMGGNAGRARRGSAGELLRVEGLSRDERVRNVSLTVHAGEIVGIAGLVGSGRTELLRLIYGADRADSGAIFLDGAAQATRIDSTRTAVAHGIGLLTEDRKSQGMLAARSIAENTTIADLSAVSRGGWINQLREREVTQRWMQKLRIRASGVDQPIDELSGGNQQKVLLARWLHRDCRVLLLDEPTRGVDIGARADIYAELDALASAGKALLMVSSDLLELMELCDRIAVMSAGVLVQIFERGSWSEAALLAAAFSQHAAASHDSLGQRA
jgi:ribose transport system ATP-binding protein